MSRPILPLGRDVGSLPGDIEEKLNPWMQPIYDNVEFLMGLGKQERKTGRSYQELIDLGYMYYVLGWLGPLGGWIFRRGMYKKYYNAKAIKN